MQRGNHARDHRRSHCAVLDAHGIGEFHWVGFGRIRREVEACRVGRIHKGIMHAFVEAHVDECFAQIVQARAFGAIVQVRRNGIFRRVEALFVWRMRTFHRNIGQSGREIVEPVSAADFLDNVDFTRNIRTPCGHFDFDFVGIPVVRHKTDGFEQFFEFLAGKGNAEDRFNPCSAKRQVDGGVDGDKLIVDGHEFGCIGLALLQQPDGSRGRAGDALGIDKTLEAVRTFGVQTKAFARFAYARRMERCDLEDNPRRRLADFGIGTAHHTGNGYGLFTIGNHDVGII